MNYSIRPATSADVSEIDLLLPRLADFEIPKHREPEQLWHGDRDLIHQWSVGEKTNVDVVVAVHDNQVVGVAAISLKPELLSYEPSAHLELLALGTEAEGMGIGSALMSKMESIALSKGATSISLHVFARNTRARALYKRQGYEGELLRYFKPLI